ncbi:amino acid adenylation domain-containing protein [Haloactinospora alba]|uniref:Amino acid adenylation domain-containing protein n=1 Tax=Haloactinospora alba TaxID=405555 RepID=A0A543N9A4_9ACTN|nr:non-ribosomal peptide synthetase [Haloactinospora alba]TQN28387.1 amino acid adenylation domain-containing protein [Haloactinospora alba]
MAPARTAHDTSREEHPPQAGGPRPPLPRVVQGHARAIPDAPAVVHGEDELTYAELNQRANNLARRLRSHGVDRGDVVGLHMGRSLDWVVAMLAALKSGAVCMSLDPDAPAERNARAVATARVAVLVRGAAEEGEPGPSSVPTVRCDARAPVATGTDDPDLAVSPDDLAYALHTSGSSGQPKIVLAQHSWLSAGAAAGAEVNGTTSHDRGSWLGPAGAGIAIHEVCSLLWRGASVHVVDQEVLTSPPALRDWLLANRITQSFVVTPLGEMLQTLEWPAETPLRLMTLGGDKLNRWAPADLPFEITVSYGSLETFQIANALHPWEARCTPRTATPADRSAPPPVGRPLPGVRVHVLEDDLTPTLEGEIGELWIDTGGLSLGYLDAPALTADRFRPNPFGAAGSRLYRSGDAGRFRGDGVLEHHGRIDDVVKVRGHRVEVGEVEWTLGSHPGVAQVCVVAVRSEEDGATQLVACVVPEGDVSPGELRAYTAARLPEPMVPVAYVPMDRLPRNTSDKVDRLALPPDDWWRWRPTRRYREPRGDVEARVAALVAELLGLERVGADDSFVELGGDSLLAARLQARITESLGVRIAMRDMWEAESLGDLAGRVERRRSGEAEPEALPRIVPRKRS